MDLLEEAVNLLQIKYVIKNKDNEETENNRG